MTEIKKASAGKVSTGNDAKKGKDAPDNELPGIKPDQGLPGEQPEPDQGLPGQPGRPTQGLPGSPDNTLPGQPPSGADRPVDPDYGISADRPDQGLPGEQPGIDNSLPGSQPRPDQGLPGQPPRPDQGLPEDLPEIDNELPPVDPDDILDDIAHAEKIEIVYCDGNGPLGMPALKVTKSDLKMTSNGLKVERQEVLIYGPGREQRAYELDGYALIADGKQLAYAKRPEPLTVGNGMTMNVADDIIFPVAERDSGDRDERR